jgi:hypothetical protein
VAGAGCHGSGGAAAGDRAVHKSRIGGFHRPVSEAKPIRYTGPKLLDHNIGFGAQFQNPIPLRWILEIRRVGALSAI